VNQPPRTGPITDATPYIAATIPVKIGRLCKGTECARMIRPPENIPEQPIPAIALPTISTAELGAIPHTNDPTSNIPTIRQSYSDVTSKMCYQALRGRST
jgi:hypothetical protein